MDLFGTLALPPPVSAFVRRFPIVCRSPSDPATRLLMSGFPAVLIAREMGVNLDSAAVLNLTRPFPTASHFVAGLLTKWPDLKRPRRTTIALVDEITEFSVKHTRLAPYAGVLLDALVRREVPLLLISDVSLPFSSVVGRLHLERWFPRPILSCDTGRLKRNGAAFRAIPSADRCHWIMIGDSWQSDVVGGLQAGLSVVLVDRSRKHPGRILANDVHMVISTSSEHVGIRIADDFRPLLPTFLPISIAALEANPAKHFEISNDGRIRLKILTRVEVVNSLRALTDRVGDIE
jgi:phosphoglycolate phosphatase-like HAD superfamily hydrolase